MAVVCAPAIRPGLGLVISSMTTPVSAPSRRLRRRSSASTTRPVNALSPEVIDGLDAAVARRRRPTTAVRAIVVIGAGRTFIAGADIKGLEQLAWGADAGAPEMHDLLQRIEDCAKPVVMAMHGTALGGGLELAMAGHYRVAVADAQIGQPEVNLGIIPGAEGTQRLPRLVGVEKALEMCVSGKPIKAAEALRDRPDRPHRRRRPARAGAVGVRARDGGARRRRIRKTRERQRQAARRRGAAGAARGRPRAGAQDAPPPGRRRSRPSTRIEAAATLPFDEGCARERELFFECVRLRAVPRR